MAIFSQRSLPRGRLLFGEMKKCAYCLREAAAEDFLPRLFSAENNRDRSEKLFSSLGIQNEKYFP